MQNSILKSTGAVVAGMLTGAVLSIATDKILEGSGILKTDPFAANSVGMIALVVIYRTLYNIAGCYLAARLAPSKPMKHAIILGVIGLAFAILGTLVMWHVPPHWYPLSLIILTLPAAWLGGKLALKHISTKNI